jgi:hypothetical protein
MVTENEDDIHFKDEIKVLLVSTYCLTPYTKRGSLF